MSKKMILFRYLKKFLLSILVLITTLCVVTKLTILNRSFVEKQFNSDHYKNVEETLKTKMKESMISSGIDDKVIDTMFTDVDVKKSVRETLDIIYNNSNKKIDTSLIRERLEKNIKDNLEEHNYQMTDENGYKEFVDSTIKIYENEFIMLNKVNTVGSYMNKINRVFTILSLLSLGILLVIVIYFYKKMPKYLPTALFTTSFVITFGAYYIYKVAGLSSITIISGTFSDILRKIINNTFNTFYIVSIVYIVLGIILCLFVRKHKHRHHKHRRNK